MDRAEMIEFVICDKPATCSMRETKYAQLKRALMDLPEGKCILVPHDTFPPKRHPESLFSGRKKMGGGIRMRTRPEGLYLWMEPNKERS